MDIFKLTCFFLSPQSFVSQHLLILPPGALRFVAARPWWVETQVSSVSVLPPALPPDRALKAFRPPFLLNLLYSTWLCLLKRVAIVTLSSSFSDWHTHTQRERARVRVREREREREREQKWALELEKLQSSKSSQKPPGSFHCGLYPALLHPNKPDLKGHLPPNIR